MTTQIMPAHSEKIERYIEFSRLGRDIIQKSTSASSHLPRRGDLIGGHMSEYTPADTAHPLFKNIANQKFGRWLTIKPFRKKKILYWLCVCECGTEKMVASSSLLGGRSNSCNCLNAEINAKVNATHGMSKTPEYSVWVGIKKRCLNKNSKSYPDYGARGIRVCPRWRDSFENFLQDVGLRPSKHHTLERKNNDGDYDPENCVWATRREQAVNTRRNLNINYGGLTMTASDWEKHLGFRENTIGQRMRRGWSAEKAIRTPIRNRNG